MRKQLFAKIFLRSVPPINYSSDETALLKHFHEEHAEWFCNVFVEQLSVMHLDVCEDKLANLIKATIFRKKISYEVIKGPLKSN